MTSQPSLRITWLCFPSFYNLLLKHRRASIKCNSYSDHMMAADGTHHNVSAQRTPVTFTINLQWSIANNMENHEPTCCQYFFLGLRVRLANLENRVSVDPLDLRWDFDVFILCYQASKIEHVTADNCWLLCTLSFFDEFYSFRAKWVIVIWIYFCSKHLIWLILNH